MTQSAESFSFYSAITILCYHEYMDENKENKVAETSLDALNVPDAKGLYGEKHSNKKFLLFIILGIFLFSGGGAFGALYTGVWNPGWNPFDDNEGSVAKSQNEMAKNQEVVFDVNKILGKELREIERLLGESTEENGNWREGGVVIKIREIRGITNIVEEVELEFLELQDPTYKDLLSAAGVAIPEVEPVQGLDTPTYYFVDGYGFISFPLLNNPNRSAPYSIVVSTQDALAKEVMGTISYCIEDYFKENESYISTNGELILINRENALSSDIANKVWPLCDEREFILPPENVSYGYRSDGETFYEVTIPLKDQSDPQCTQENDLCIYNVRNGKLINLKNYLVERQNFSVVIPGLWREDASSEEIGLSIEDLNSPTLISHYGNGDKIEIMEDFPQSALGSIENIIKLLNENDDFVLDGIFLLQENSEKNGFIVVEESLCSTLGERKNIGSFSYACGKGDGEFAVFGFVPQTSELNNGHSYLFMFGNEDTEDTNTDVFKKVIESFKTKQP